MIHYILLTQTQNKASINNFHPQRPLFNINEAKWDMHDEWAQNSSRSQSLSSFMSNTDIMRTDLADVSLYLKNKAVI